MNVKELRIGNIVMWGGNFHQLSSINGNGFVSITKKNLEPRRFFIQKSKYVKLTKEWLIRFGFENKDNFCFELNKHQIRLSVGNPYPYWIDSNYICNISYVHQLQNLYFALTGEELTK